MASSSGKTVVYQGTKSGRIVNVVHHGDLAFNLGTPTEDVPTDVVKALSEDEYYSDFQFDFDSKGGNS